MQRFLTDESGATAVEYGLIAVMVSLAIIGGATTLGQALAPVFTTAASSITPP